MRVLVVDDEASKRRQVVALLRSLAGVDLIDEASSYQGALAQLRNQQFDWVVLDMRLTTFDMTAADAGGTPRKFGGDEVLRKMTRRGISAKVIVLTQYSLFRESGDILTLDVLKERLRQRYAVFVDLIPFQHSNNEWQVQLTALISPEST